MHRRLIAVTTALATVVVASGLAYAHGSLPLARSDSAAQPGQPTPELTAAPVAPPSPTPSPSEPTVEPSPSPTPSPTPTGPTAEELAAMEAARAELRLVQQRLADLGYYGGAVDGEDGPRTRAAVMAFQKVNRLGADGVAGPKTRAALDAPVAPTLKGGEADRIEVDLTLQVAYIVKGGQLLRTLPVSSGSGETYETKGGGTAVALTPVGDFRILRRIVGERHADLGVLYDPLYIYKGWALHGSNHVPAHPASHGCVRLTRWDATWVASLFPNRTQVRIYGGTHTFPIGSTAPGTDNPGGDTEPDAEVPAEEQSPSPSPSPATPTPSPSPSEPGPSPSEPGPSPSPSGEPSPSPEPSASPPPSPGGSASPSPSATPGASPAPTPSPTTAP